MVMIEKSSPFPGKSVLFISLFSKEKTIMCRPKITNVPLEIFCIKLGLPYLEDNLLDRV